MWPAATHVRAARAGATDWPAILDLYDQLLALSRSPVVVLNPAAAVAHMHGLEAALAELEFLENDPKLRH